MNVDIFKNKLDLIHRYMNKLKRDNVPTGTQKILIKSYANDLRINLTNIMILEILSYKVKFY
ncbi:hypothetical protein IZY60_02075 [Lutibacter sp. B2]|nr:hypothetical protein [Lutibacter sp. B2]